MLRGHFSFTLWKSQLPILSALFHMQSCATWLHTQRWTAYTRWSHKIKLVAAILICVSTCYDAHIRQNCWLMHFLEGIPCHWHTTVIIFFSLGNMAFHISLIETRSLSSWVSDSCSAGWQFLELVLEQLLPSSALAWVSEAALSNVGHECSHIQEKVNIMHP